MWLNRHAAGPGEVTTQGTCRTGSWGAEFYEVAAEPGETVITKHRYSAFVGTSLDLTLRTIGVESLLFTGVDGRLRGVVTARWPVRRVLCLNGRGLLRHLLAGAARGFGTSRGQELRHGGHRRPACQVLGRLTARPGIQVTDVWLLDPATRHFRHLPDMPAAVQLKFTSMAWASDSRLVMLAQTSGPSGDRDLVAVWKPGQRQIALRLVRLPARNSGSDAFVVW